MVSFVKEKSWQSRAEKTFKLLISLAAFSLLSSAVPVGLVNLFFYLAVLLAIPLAWPFRDAERPNFIEGLGLIIFGIFVVSVVSTGGGVVPKVNALMEYRVFLLLPILGIAVRSINGAPDCLLLGIVSGSIVAILGSYLIFFGFFEGSGKSLGDSIFHGFVVGTTLSITLPTSFDLSRSGKVRGGAALVSFLAILSVYVIEDGRTAYLSTAAILCAFLITKLPIKYMLLALLLVVLGIYFGFEVIDPLHSRLLDSLDSFRLLLAGNSEASSLGMRFEFYRSGLNLGLAHPLFGVGMAEIDSILAQSYADGTMLYLTDNLHSEFLTWFVGLGIAGPGLLLLFFGSLLVFGLKCAKDVSSQSRLYGEAMILFATLLFVHSLFNSSFKDFGEKHVAILVIALFSVARSPNKSES